MITGILWKLECHLRFRTSYYLQKQSIKDHCFFQVTCVCSFDDFTLLNYGSQKFKGLAKTILRGYER